MFSVKPYQLNQKKYSSLCHHFQKQVFGFIETALEHCVVLLLVAFCKSCLHLSIVKFQAWGSKMYSSPVNYLI